jgi:hydrogenase maturation factor
MVMCIVTLTGCSDVKFNQVTNKDELVTRKYSIAQIEALKSKMETGRITFSKFKRDFDVQCIRKTHQGYYVILLLDSGGSAFIFFDEKNALSHIMIVGEFKRKIEFQAKVVEQMTLSEVLEFDPNAVFAPVSSMTITVHIVQEGVYIIKYLRFSDGNLILDPTVDTIEFLENDVLSTNPDPFIRDSIPFIFELDKISE